MSRTSIIALMASALAVLFSPQILDAQTTPICEPIVFHWNSMPGIGPLLLETTLTAEYTGVVTLQTNTLNPNGGINLTNYGQRQQVGAITFTTRDGYRVIYQPSNGNPQSIPTNIPGVCLVFCIQGWNPPAPYVCQEPDPGMVINVYEVPCGQG